MYNRIWCKLNILNILINGYCSELLILLPLEQRQWRHFTWTLCTHRTWKLIRLKWALWHPGNLALFVSCHLSSCITWFSPECASIIKFFNHIQASQSLSTSSSLLNLPPPKKKCFFIEKGPPQTSNGSTHRDGQSKGEDSRDQSQCCTHCRTSCKTSGTSSST